MTFLTTVEVRHVKERTWELTSPLSYAPPEIPGIPPFRIITVPKGFKTDFASIPRAAQLIYGRPSGEVAGPSVVHDYLYSKDAPSWVSRARADHIFLCAMGESGVGWFKRKSFYYAVRAFGSFSYEGNHA